MPFSESWLETRQPFDEKARNVAIEKSAIEHLSPHDTVMDVGTGTGNNFFYYQHRLPSVKWILIDNDENLIGECRKKIQNFDHDVTVKQQSIFHLKDLSKIHLITANAIFDLFSLDQFVKFASQMCSHKVMLLATLNYHKMHFSPAATNDKIFIKLYEQHMERKQNFGHAMGSCCTQKIQDVLQQQFGYHVQVGASNWEIDGRKHRNMILHMLSFIEHAIGNCVPEINTFCEWIRDKKETKDLKLYVNHADIFAHP